METTESKAISSLSGYMYLADISIVNLRVHEAYAHVYHLVIYYLALESYKVLIVKQTDHLYYKWKLFSVKF